jgi:hypothetical protein
MCGRPLGLQFFAMTGDLYIADAYMGLMKVGPDGGEAQVLATQADGGAPFHFVNGLDVDQATGDVYFTDSSATYPRRWGCSSTTRGRSGSPCSRPTCRTPTAWRSAATGRMWWWRTPCRAQDFHYRKLKFIGHHG